MNNELKSQSDISGKLVWIVLALIIVGLLSWFVYKQFIYRNRKPINQIGSLQISSPSFKDGGVIPSTFTCKGDAVNPPLQVKNTPANAKSLVLILHDPDAPAKDFAHWLMWNIKLSTERINENSVPTGVMQGTNDFAKIGYGAPCPPNGTHTYYFDLYALDTKLSLTEQTQYSDLLKAIQNHIISQTTLSAVVTK